MRKIILASKSKARKRLLKQLGLKFQVANSKVKEKRVRKRGLTTLVCANALGKAKDVANRFNSGVVIGADTVVLAGTRIIGKPKNEKDAFETLKLLSRKPPKILTPFYYNYVGKPTPIGIPAPV